MKKFLLLVLAICSLGLNPADAAINKKKKPKNQPKVLVPPPNPIDSKIGKAEKIPGLFNLYRDTASGSLMMLVKDSQLNKEYIYFSVVANGNNTTGHVKGLYRDNKVFTIRKYYNDLEFINQNTGFYFDASSPLARSADANISNAVLASETIIASDEKKGLYLINADHLFLSETFHQIKTPPHGPQGPGAFGLGMLSKSKTRYESVKNYPENTDIVVRYVYDNPASRGTGSEAISDGRFVEIYLQHSLIEMPENDFQPRFDDPRVGYFCTQVNDMTTKNVINYKDLVHRWNLVKKDPSAAISEPVKPIVWWIENTTPHEYRQVIKDAILSWNIAFEKAGFKNAVQIFEQPDDADWDAGDIRYNVLRWTSSPEPRFGGYGPSFVNPRTGEILGADIMLEWIFITNRLRSQRVFEPAGPSQNFRDMILNEDHQMHSMHSCEAGEQLHNQYLLGMQVLAANNASAEELDSFLKQSIYYLILHEVGHTLGLNHNMKASQLWSPEDLHDMNKTMKIGLTGSVMDYPAINFSHKPNTKTQYYTNRPGPYDIWAIEFGYYTENSAAADAARREKILARSTEPQLCFGNDADDMRAPGKAIDPRVMIGDMSNDAVSYAEARIKLIHKLQGNLLSNYGTENRSYHELRSHYAVLSNELATQSGVISRYIGGVYVDRSFSNQKSSVAPFTPVPYETQKKAMNLLGELVFAPNAFEVSSDLAVRLQMQRRGFGFFSGGEDPKLHLRALSIQQMVLIHLMHPNTLERISNSELYGNKYSLGEMFRDLTNNIFQADLKGDINTYRQNLQILYVEVLGFVYEHPAYDYLSKAKAHAQLVSIQKMLQSSLPSSTINAKEHKNFILSSIKTILEEKQ